MNEEPQYSLGAYLRDHWLSALLAAVACGGLLVALPALGTPWDGCLLAASLVASLALAAGLWNYGRTARYWREMAELASVAERACELSGLLREPGFLEGRMAHEAIDRLCRLAGAEQGALKEERRAYGEYIELWVHEAKTPLAATRLVLAGMHGPEADKLRAELERTEWLVEQALYAARSTTLTNDYAIREVGLAEACRSAVKRHTRFLVARGMSANIEVPEDAKVLADEPWLVFCLQQVVVNAAKYDATQLCFRTYDLEPATPRGRTVLEVSDDGCGIPAADVPRVFERGFTGEVGRAHGSATGMGLYLVATLCERMGLDVSLASEEGVGTTVSVAFPHDRRRMAERESRGGSLTRLTAS